MLPWTRCFTDSDCGKCSKCCFGAIWYCCVVTCEDDSDCGYYSCSGRCNRYKVCEPK